MTDGWKQAKQLHVILPNGETAGPHTAEEVESLLEDETIQPDNFGYCEGMPDWRSVLEALVWSRRGLAQLVRPEIEEQMNLLLAAQINEATARAALRTALRQKGVDPLDGEVEAVETILHTNTDLKRRHDNYLKENSQVVLEMYPAVELKEWADLKFPRDWNAAWENAGGRRVEGRRVARVDDLVWTKLSDFGVPFPPFSFERWMETEIISRSEAVELGVLGEKDVVLTPTLPARFKFVGMEN